MRGAGEADFSVVRIPVRGRATKPTRSAASKTSSLKRWPIDEDDALDAPACASARGLCAGVDGFAAGGASTRAASGAAEDGVAFAPARPGYVGRIVLGFGAAGGMVSAALLLPFLLPAEARISRASFSSSVPERVLVPMRLDESADLEFAQGAFGHLRVAVLRQRSLTEERLSTRVSTPCVRYVASCACARAWRVHLRPFWRRSVRDPFSVHWLDEMKTSV